MLVKFHTMSATVVDAATKHGTWPHLPKYTALRTNCESRLENPDFEKRTDHAQSCLNPTDAEDNNLNARQHQAELYVQTS